MIATLKKVKTFYDANLQAEADTIATDQGVNIQNIKEIITAWKRIVQFPTVLISPLTTDRLDDDDSIYVYSKTHKIAVAIVHKNANTVDLQNTILVYAKAVEKLTAKNPRYGSPPIFNRVMWDGIDYSDIVEEQKNRDVLQMAIIGLSIVPIAESDEINIPNA